MKFTVKKAVTLPIRKLAINEAAYLRITDPIFTGKQLADQKEPASLANCIDLETGEQCQIVVPQVLHGILDDNYADNSYVGVNFQVIKGKMPSGKKYHPFTVCEVEVEEDAPAAKNTKK